MGATRTTRIANDSPSKPELLANDSPSKPELAWLTAHVAQVEEAEATEAAEAAEAEAAEAILEDSYQRVVEPASSSPMRLRLCASAPLPPGVPLRGKKISLTLQRAVSSREHGSMSRGAHPPPTTRWHAVAPTPRATSRVPSARSSSA